MTKYQMRTAKTRLAVVAGAGMTGLSTIFWLFGAIPGSGPVVFGLCTLGILANEWQEFWGYP